ncbi:MAG TPA: DUF1566 domain-containing protein [Saprospiraceae bacterium]|nr:DUF1566 domain-containing protein [Saprospiraceae bacterium]
MKKGICLLLMILFGSVRILAQGVGIGTLTPHPNAALDVRGVNKGLLIPRGDASSRNVLNTNTAKGLMVYDTTSNLVWIHNGNGLASGWQSLTTGASYWTLNGALGTEIKNSNIGGLWSANATTVLSDAGLIAPPVSGPGTRLMWIPQKSAFRVGTTDSGHWDAGNIGNWSFASGLNTTANASYAFAMGTGSKASGLTSTSLGWFTKATGDISSSLGFKTYAKSYASVALGRWNDSITISNNTTWINADPLFMIGNGTSESARHNALVVYKNGNMILKSPAPFYYSKLPAEYPLPVSGEGTRMMWLPEISAFRVGTVADTAWDSPNVGVGSFALGLDVMASGIGSTAMGSNTQARAHGSTSMGVGTRAKGFGSTVIGMYNDRIITEDETDPQPTTPLFIIGNGDNLSDRSNAMVVRKDGHVGIGTDAPSTYLHVDVGTHISDGFLVQGNSSGSATVPDLGAGNRMMFYPAKGAFRAGGVASAGWDNSFTGNYSVAMGYNTSARGSSSTALGIGSTAQGDYSLATGGSSIANGNYSTAMGKSTKATGINSIAMGEFTLAGGLNSTAMGYLNLARSSQSTAAGTINIAKGFSSFVVGMYNDSLMTATETAVNPTTPLFIVGNGDGVAVGERHNAMVVRKDGNVGIGTNIPVTRLNIVGNTAVPAIPGPTSNGVLRIGVSGIEGIDMGKMGSTPYAAWMQAGYNGATADPISLQPSGGNVGIGTTIPLSSAALDINSTTRGFLPPRMTFANRNAISSPVPGLMIWCSNCGAYGQMQIYNGAYWSNLTGSPGVGTPVVGMYDAGGIIAYILQPGDPGYMAGEVHGLIVASEDQAPGSGAPWGCSGTNIPGAAGTAIGTGNQNTIDIITGCVTTLIAARDCSNYVTEGYSDWYLPSKDELNKLYLNQAAIGNLSGGFYWSSSEFSAGNAWTQDLSAGAGTVANQSKSSSYYVRAVRSF